jgi:hypothetical protein
MPWRCGFQGQLMTTTRARYLPNLTSRFQGVKLLFQAPLSLFVRRMVSGRCAGKRPQKGPFTQERYTPLVFNQALPMDQSHSSRADR